VCPPQQPVAGRKEPAAKKGGGKHAAAGGDDVGDPEAWLADKAKREEFAARFALRELLDAAGGLVRIENFLPTAVAERVLQVGPFLCLSCLRVPWTMTLWRWSKEISLSSREYGLVCIFRWSQRRFHGPHSLRKA
jgi:hypothetical protein